MSAPGYKILPPLYTEADRQREQETPEKAPYRSDFRRDYARLLHCPSFRRLQGKTQLFPGSNFGTPIKLSGPPTKLYGCPEISEIDIW